MKSKIDELSSEEKSKILEMYYENNSQLVEQKMFSNLKSNVRGLASSIKTGVQNVASSFSNTQGNAFRPSAGLQQDLTKVQSRSGDLMKTIEPMMNELNQMISKLQSNQNAYGTGYEAVQNDFLTQINNLRQSIDNTNKFLNAIRGYQPNYQQQTAQPAAASQQTAKPAATSQQSKLFQSKQLGANPNNIFQPPTKV